MGVVNLSTSYRRVGGARSHFVKNRPTRRASKGFGCGKPLLALRAGVVYISVTVFFAEC
jgi:hypothetical protein